MPEQPLSGRLSLAQAVVSANSRSKAVSIGLEKRRGAEEDGWGNGQPKVRILGREIHVLKRSGYDWRPEEELAGVSGDNTGDKNIESMVGDNKTSGNGGLENSTAIAGVTIESGQNEWSTSASVTSKKSTFVARAIAVTSSYQARSALQQLLASNKDLRDASHNITAWRVQGDHGGIIDECNDDGEAGGGRYVLQLLQSNGIVGVMLVMTRWYGGIMLGPDRWRIISQVCRDALSQRLRVTGIIGQEALWGLDLEAMRSTDAPVTGGTAGGMPIYKPESARAYIMKAFAPPPEDAQVKKNKSGVTLEKAIEKNLGLLLDALDLLFGSWVEHISRDELDRRAWSWYVQVRPDVEDGVTGWGGKGQVKLIEILKLRRKG